MTINLSRRRRARGEITEQEVSPNVPPVLPVVTMTVQPDATLRVVVDGEPFDPPPFAPSWQRHSFAQIISEVAEQHHSPARVVVHELDGTVYTDIVTAALHPASLDQSPPAEPPASVEDGDSARDATEPSHPLALSPTHEVILLGRVSGTCIVGHPA